MTEDRPLTENKTKPWMPSPDGLADARKHLGKRLMEERLKADLTMREAAEIAGVPKSTYERFEKGTAIVGYQPLRALAGRYGCKMMDLMPTEQYPSAPKDPEGRLIFMRQRNEKIQAGNADRAIKAMKEKRAQA